MSHLKDYAAVLVSFILIMSAVITVASTKANQLDLEALQELHINDTQEARKQVIIEKIAEYEDDIHILESKPSPSSHDISTIKYLKGRQNGKQIELNNLN